MPDEANPIRAYTFNLLHDIGADGSDARQSEADALIRRLEAHDASERRILDQYEAFARESEDEGVQYLMRLIVEDEKRHNAFLEAMSTEIRRSLDWDRGRRALPTIKATGAQRRKLLTQAKRFADTERDGKRQLDQLEEVVRRFDGGEGILHLIVELMAYDTQKHVVMLDYIRKHLEHD